MQLEEAVAEAIMPGFEAFNGFNFGEDEYDFARTEFRVDYILETMATTQNVPANQNIPSESFDGIIRRSQDTNPKSSAHRM